MANVIGSLRIELPGSTMYSKQECFVNSENGKMVPNFDKFNHEQIMLEGTVFDKKNKKKVFSKDLHTIHTRKSKPATQVIPITEEGYEGMLKDCPMSITPAKWKRMNDSQRFNASIDAIAHDFGGKVLDYTFFE